jgi:hypothetical protein
MALDPDSQEELFEAIGAALEALGAHALEIVGSDGLYRMTRWDLFDATVIQTEEGMVTVQVASGEPLDGEWFLDLAHQAMRARAAVTARQDPESSL